MPISEAVLSDDHTDGLRDLYFENASQDVADLRVQLDKVKADAGAWADAARSMREIAHNVKGQGSSFGYPLMTRVGDSFHRLVKALDAVDEAKIKLLDAHIATLQTVLDKDIRGTGGEVGDALSARLEGLVDKALG